MTEHSPKKNARKIEIILKSNLILGQTLKVSRKLRLPDFNTIST
jgi:hypothetical protein